MTQLPLWLLAVTSAIILTACDNSTDAQLPAQEQIAAPYLEAENSPPSGRLPELARPRSYTLDLTLDPRRENFSGSVTIDIELLRASDVVWLHGKDLRVTSSRAMLNDGSSLSAEYEEVLDSGVAALRFPQVIPAGEISLELQYNADFDRNLTGLFKVEEQGEIYALAKSESIQARRYLPSFDEPGLKASYNLSLTVPNGYQTITNTPELKREAVGEGMERVTYARSRPMPTYLLSLAVGPFDVVERPPLPANEFRSEPIPLRGFTRKGRGGDMNYILDITPRMVEIYEREMKRGYPFAKLDIVAAPQWPSGATELSAAITYREQRILVGDDPAPGARLDLVNVHSHELAHMWFGNLVTPPWWDDLWLKEGFATWGTSLVMTLLEPEGGHDVSARGRAISAMTLDSLASTRAIREPIADNHNIRNAYDSITYLKSLGLIHMVDQYFGPSVFRPALGRYVAKFADGEADSTQFYEVIGAETNTPELTETFRSFVEQKGVPLVSAQLQCEGDKVSVQVQQQRHKALGSTISANDSSWNIPLCLRTAGGNKHCEIMVEPKQTIELPDTQCPAWVLPNAGGDGYYRWNLPEQQWLAVLEDFDSFSPTEALSIVDSALSAFEAGQLPPGLVWKVIEASSRSTQRQVVVAPLKHLRRYNEHCFANQQRSVLAARLRAWYEPVLARAEGSDDPDQKILHAALLGFMATVAEDPATRLQLQRKAEAFTGFGVTRDDKALNSDLYDSALTIAVQDIGKPFVNHLITLRQELDDPQFESASANALGRVTDSTLLPLIHELALSDAMGSREAFGLLRRSTATRETREENWQWVMANFEQIVAKIPAQWRRSTPVFAGSFCDEEAVSQLETLFSAHGDITPGYERELSQTRERLQLCMALRDQGTRLAEAL